MSRSQDAREMEVEWFVQDLQANPDLRDQIVHLHSRWWTDVDFYRILDVAARTKTRATFAFLGRDVVHREAVIRRMVSEGHEVVTHGSRHFLFDERFSRDDIASDLAPCVAELRNLGASANGMWMCSRGGMVEPEALQGLLDVGIDWFASPSDYHQYVLPEGVRFVPTSSASDLGLMYFEQHSVQDAVEYWRGVMESGNEAVLRFGVYLLARGDDAILQAWESFLSSYEGGVPACEWEPGLDRPGIYFDASNHLGRG